MRVERSSVRGRVSGSSAPAVVLLEAPPGYGKTWLARRALDQTAVRVRGDLGHLRADDLDGHLLVDDAHLLPPDQLDRLIELIEDADTHRRLVIAGRLLPFVVHDAVQLVDGVVLDAAALAITAEELGSTGPESPEARVVEVADGCIRIVAAALDQPDPVAVATRMVRATAVTVQQDLDEAEVAVLGLLARAPGLEPQLLDRLVRPGFVDRCLGAGVPLRRQVTGELDLALAAGFRHIPVVADTAIRLADELIERDRPLEAITLLLDAGLHDTAATRLGELGESAAESIEPRALLSLLARLGSAADDDPALLLLRSTAARDIGQVDQAAAQIDQAVARSVGAPPQLRHRVEVEAARARLTEGNVRAAISIAERTLADLGPGEERTYARAYDLLGQCAATTDGRPELQRASEHYQVAAAAWDSCGEHARARATRRDLAMSALIPLGRFDEALAVLGQLLSSSQMSDTERSWVMVMEGFALYHANRLDSADARFARVTDLGYLHENPRLVATAAWGHGLVAWRRNDRAATIRRLASAENTALGHDDDVLGIPFLCDAANALGAFGELELAEQYYERAVARSSLFPDQLTSTRFVLDARKGRRGDVERALRATAPAHWWRIHLVAGYALASNGELEAAARHLVEAERELTALGIGDAAALGEARIYEQLRSLLAVEPAPPPTRTAPAPVAAGRATGPYVSVIGSPMTVRAGGPGDERGTDGQDALIPPGNPQRLVGVVAAYGGSATLDQIAEAVWPGDPVEASRARLRNVLMRLRRVGGEILVRSGSGVRFAPGVRCDFQEFERRAKDATATARADPELAGRLATEALALADGTAFADFEYEEWVIQARRSMEQQLIGLLDLLSVQAEDAGDYAAAQAYAERALRLDRYSDSRYVRLSELLAMQDRVAAAIAVLDDAAEVARELGGGAPSNLRQRRTELVRRAALR